MRGPRGLLIANNAGYSTIHSSREVVPSHSKKEGTYYYSILSVSTPPLPLPLPPLRLPRPDISNTDCNIANFFPSFISFSLPFASKTLRAASISSFCQHSCCHLPRRPRSLPLAAKSKRFRKCRLRIAKAQTDQHMPRWPHSAGYL